MWAFFSEINNFCVVLWSANCIILQDLLQLLLANTNGQNFFHYYYFLCEKPTRLDHCFFFWLTAVTLLLNNVTYLWHNVILIFRRRILGQSRSKKKFAYGLFSICILNILIYSSWSIAAIKLDWNENLVVFAKKVPLEQYLSPVSIAATTSSSCNSIHTIT